MTNIRYDLDIEETLEEYFSEDTSRPPSVGPIGTKEEFINSALEDVGAPSTGKPLWKKVIELVTAHHIEWRKPYREGPIDPETGLPLTEPSARMPILEDPILTFAIPGGVSTKVAKGTIGQRLLKGGKTGLDWLTGGLSTAPKVGVKAVTKLAEAKSAKAIEQTMIGAAKTAEKGLGVKLGKAGEVIVSEAAPISGKAAASSISEILQQMKAEAPPVSSVGSYIDRARSNIGELKREVGFMVNSPGLVFKRGKHRITGHSMKVGEEFYRTGDLAEQALNRFRTGEIREFEVALGGIKPGSKESIRVGRVLDESDSALQSHLASQLTEKERTLYQFFKKKYDFLIHKYVRQLCGTDESYKKVLKAAARGKKAPPKMRVQDLGPGEKVIYNNLKKYAQAIRGNTPVDKLTGLAKQRYTQTQKAMDKLLHKAWRDHLTPNELKAYSLLRRKIKNYLPHMFDKDQLKAAFDVEKSELMKKIQSGAVTDAKEINKIKTRIRQIENSLIELEGGGMVEYNALPQSVKFGSFEVRTGVKGYSFDSVKAYKEYLHGISRKLYTEPALHKMRQLYTKLDPHLKPYAQWFADRWVGRTHSYWDRVASKITSAQWVLKLGLNPRSALVNLTQRLNTLVEAGVFTPNPLNSYYAGKAWTMGFTQEGKELFRQTGLIEEIPAVLMEGPVSGLTETIRRFAGIMFTQAEKGNRKHAFLTGYLKAKGRGADEKSAIQYGIDLVHKTQFRYGTIGLPRILSSPAGRVGFQFFSYPIKQMELMMSWLKNEPTKLFSYLAIAEGSNKTLEEFFDTDLSNAIGLGANWGEALQTLNKMRQGDITKMFSHIRLIPRSGGGLLPSGPGPTFTSALKIAERAWNREGWEQFKKEIAPVQWKRGSQLIKAIKNRQGGTFPVYNTKGDLLYHITASQLARNFAGPRPAKMSQEYMKEARKQVFGKEYDEIIRKQLEMCDVGDTGGALKLFDATGVWPSEEMFENKELRKWFTTEEREMMLEPSERRLYIEERVDY